MAQDRHDPLEFSEDPYHELERMNRQALAGGGEKAAAKQHELGKQTARERIEQLCDPDSFVEIDRFVTTRFVELGMDQKRFLGDGVVTGSATIDGQSVFLAFEDFTVMGGSLGEMHANKISRVQDLALDMGVPFLQINDSGGARIQEGVASLNGYGKMFLRNSRASGVIPQFSVILGPCAGGAVYSPALTDFVFMVEGISRMFVTGPNVIRNVTGEEVSAEDLGGARVHNELSGVAHFYAPNETVCFAQIRRLLSFLPANNTQEPPLALEIPDDPPSVDERIRQRVPTDPNQPYDIRHLIQRIVDGGDFLEVQARFAPNIVVGFCRMEGRTVGLVANQPAVMAGVLDIDASDKLARFVRFCDAFHLPLINLVDVPGFLPGTDQEYRGLIRHGAKILFAYCEATVPKITLILRKAYGGAYIALCSRDMGYDRILAYPTAQIAVMGPEGAVDILYRREIAKAEDAEEERQARIASYTKQFATPYAAAALGLVDEVIDPARTREALLRALHMTSTKRKDCVARKHGNLPL